MKHIILKHAQTLIFGIVAAMLSFGGIQFVSTTAFAAEKPLAAEKNPPGDIPDSQVFITYTSPTGFSLRVPEGWARTDLSDGARFADKYNVIDIAVGSTSNVPSIASVTKHEAADMTKAGRAVKIGAIKKVKLRSGPAILIVYSSNSEPNPVTNKQLRLENNRYLIYRNGKLAALNLSAPLGADNVDQWRLISNSFRWH
jgi:hypothetical protein